MFTKDSLLVTMVVWSAFGLALSAPSVFTLPLPALSLTYMFLEAYKREKDVKLAILEIMVRLLVSTFLSLYLILACSLLVRGVGLEPKRRTLPPPAPLHCKVLVHTDSGISSKELGWCSWSDVTSLSEGLNKAHGKVIVIAHGKQEQEYVVGEGWTPARWVVGGVDARVLSESAGVRGLEVGIMACRGEKNPTGLDRLRVHPLWEEDLGVWVWSREGEKVLVDEDTLEKSVQFFFRD